MRNLEVIPKIARKMKAMELFFTIVAKATTCNFTKNKDSMIDASVRIVRICFNS